MNDESVARAIWNAGAVRIDFAQPFRLPHAKPSPIFVDVRLMYHSPELRHVLLSAMESLVVATVKRVPKVIVGDETAGIPLAAWMASRLDTHFCYIRKSPKSYGLKGLIECGDLQNRTDVVIVTDLINSGCTLDKSIAEIINRSAVVEGIFTVIARSPRLNYDPFRHFGIGLHSLVDIYFLSDFGKSSGHLGAREHRLLLDYLSEACHEEIYDRII
jgi:orotate phosphoribosyltransferase